MNRRTYLLTAGSTVAGIALGGCTTEEEPATASGDTGGASSPAPTAPSTQSAGRSKTATKTAASGSDADMKILSKAFYAGDYGSFGVKGKAENVTDRTLGYVEFLTRYFTADGTRVAEGMDNATDVSKGTTITFDSRAMAMDVDPESIDNWELEVKTADY